MNRVIGEFEKNQLEKVVASLGEYQGKPRIDIRIFFQPKANPDKWIATKKGINLNPDSWGDFKKLIDEIDQAIGGDNDRLR